MTSDASGVGLAAAGGFGSAATQSGIVHVVAGVMTDLRGRILLARRTAGRDLAGAWEFPGGKVEKGESAFQALDRELHEELGIRIHAMEPLIAVPQQYHAKRILLDVYRVAKFSGKPRGKEHQALAWSPPEKLHTYPMPPADRPVVAALTQSPHYLITPAQVGSRPQFLGRIERALDAGARRLQLRFGGLPEAETLALSAEAKRLCDQAEAQLLVNGDAALADKLGCGLHLKSAQLMQLSERPIARELPLGASCHDLAQLRQAEAIGVDFAVLGPVGATPSHPDTAPMGWDGFAALREAVSLPIYALGGMRAEDVAKARRVGGQGIAAIRGLWPH